MEQELNNSELGFGEFRLKVAAQGRRVDPAFLPVSSGGAGATDDTLAHLGLIVQEAAEASRELQAKVRPHLDAAKAKARALVEVTKVDTPCRMFIGASKPLNFGLPPADTTAEPKKKLSRKKLKAKLQLLRDKNKELALVNMELADGRAARAQESARNFELTRKLSAVLREFISKTEGLRRHNSHYQSALGTATNAAKALFREHNL